MKQNALKILRKSGLMEYAEQLHLLYERVSRHKENEAFLRSHPQFIPPPIEAMHDAYKSVSYLHYWAGGKEIAGAMAAIIKRHHSHVKTILEWGCGASRVLRHLPEMFERGVVFKGADYNGASIAWSQKTFPDIQFEKNNLAPPLKEPDAGIDVTYAISVLTHLSLEQQKSWIAELRRIKAPGGILILTTHGRAAESRLLPEERAALDRQGFCVRGGVEEGSRCYLSYHRESFAREHLFAGLQVREYIPDHALIGQDVWVLG